MMMTSGLRQTPLTCSGHTRPVVFLAFSETDSSNGAYYLISASKDGKPMLRQGDTGDWIGTFEGHKGAVWGVDLNREASRAATAAADFSAKVWDAISGEELLHLQHNHIVKSVNFSSDSHRLATASSDKSLRIYDLQDSRTDPLLEFRGHTSGIKQVLFSKDDRRIISGSDDKTIRSWDTSTGDEIHKVTLKEGVRGLELSRDGNILTVASGKSIDFYDAATLTEIKSIAVPSVINTATLIQDKNVVVCGGEDFILYKYCYNTHQELDNFKGHFGPVHCVRFSPDGELYASGSEDGTLRLWQTEVGKTYGLWKCVDSLTGAPHASPSKTEAVA